MSESLERAWMEVDLRALVANGAALRDWSGVPLLPMVKADAYGLGAESVAHALEQLEPWGYGVATVVEGAELRACGIARPILVFNPLLSEELEAASAAGLTPTLGSRHAIEQWAIHGKAYHLSIDTGMSRAGVPWRDIPGLRDVLAVHPPEGVFTHFHSAELNDDTMAVQENRFRKAVAQLPSAPRVLHAEGSAAIERHHRSEWSVIRPGVFLYGVGSGEGSLVAPRPVIHVRARVVETRWVEPGDTVSYDATWTAPSRRLIATIPMGYADGYPRSLSNAGRGVVRGREVTIAGRVTMDMIMLDVTDTGCEVGDVVTMIGSPAVGNATLDAAALDAAAVARLAEMSHYELLTGLRGRLRRVYVT
ncbi:MAG: alanine racemase [Gemmatimonadaceae bacterium]|nr:alanine racemase [Gemmatimonadaceae bacterium]